MSNCIRTTFLILCIFTMGCFTSGCVSTSSSTDLGVQNQFVGFVPARIAILPCLTWPEASRYKTKPLSNARPDTFANLCEAFDKFVIEGFNGQPFMKGFSPNFVEKSLKGAGKPDQLQAVPSLWAFAPTDCLECTNIASFYQKSIADRPAWKVWLNETSLTVRTSDAVLIPTVLYAWERRYNDRGVLVLERSAAAALLLISTATGDLIWAESRAAVVPKRVLEAKVNNQDPTPPEWTQVSKQIFTDHLWADFPGRQVY